MSDNLLTIAGPFDATVLDEQTELRALARALQFARDFALLLIRCSQHDQRQRLVAALRTELPQLVMQEIHFDAPIDHLLDELRERVTQPLPDAVFVSGLEYSLPTAADAHATPLVANLNAARNSFSHVIPCPLVLWLPEYALTAIMRGAPDFFSVHSGTYYFVATPQETDDLARSLTLGDEWMAANLTLTEKQERIATIENLLADYQALPPAQRDRRAEARLLGRLGNLYWTLGRWVEAEECHRQSLKIWREVGDHVAEEQTLDNLGVVYRSQGRWAEAEKCHKQSLAICHEAGDRVGEGRTLNNLGIVYRSQGRWAEAKECYQRSLAICQEVGDRVGEGTTLGNLGIIYRSQGRWIDAVEYYQQSLAIRREIGDRVGEGQTLGNLGVVYGQQGRWTEAEKCCQQDLTICRELGDRVGEAITLSNLGNVYENQGQWTDAEKCYQRSLAISRELGDRVVEGKVLDNLALLRAAQGDIAGALELGCQAIAVLETTEDKAGLEKARRRVAKWQEQM